MKRPFDKPPISHAEQVGLLAARGMQIADIGQAEFYLKHLNYYRLAAYWLPFEADHETHRFREGTTFEAVLGLYVFDRELRLLMLDAIERVEVSIRAQWAHELARRHGPHAHLIASLAKRQWRWRADIEKLKAEVERSDEVFIRHHRENYSEELPPTWAVCEVMSLGVLSRVYSNLGPSETRSAISSAFALDERVLESWLHHLSYVRNVCAHHGRLWNRSLRILPMIPRTKPAKLKDQFVRESSSVHNTFVLLLHLMDVVAPNHHWRHRLVRLLAAHADLLPRMGVPQDWEERAIWKGPFVGRG